jgi:hypothetical protein
MARFIRLFVALLTCLAIAYNLFLWGGVAATSWVGPHIAAQARERSVLAATYMQVGRPVLAFLWLEAPARDHAQATLGAPYNEAARNPHGGLESLMLAMGARQRLAFYGAPLLVLLNGFLFWLKKRQQHRLRAL